MYFFFFFLLLSACVLAARVFVLRTYVRVKEINENVCTDTQSSGYQPERHSAFDSLIRMRLYNKYLYSTMAFSTIRIYSSVRVLLCAALWLDLAPYHYIICIRNLIRVHTITFEIVLLYWGFPSARDEIWTKIEIEHSTCILSLCQPFSIRSSTIR